MSEILSFLKSDHLIYRKAGAKEKASFVSSLIGEIESKAKLVGGVKTVDDATAIEVLKSYEKKNKEFRNIENLPENMTEMLNTELAIIENYLPKQLTEEELRDIISSIGSKQMKDIMNHLKTNYAGRYDGKLASTVAKEFV